MGIGNWMNRRVDQLIGTTPIADDREPVVKETGTPESYQIQTTRQSVRFVLTAQEKVFIERMIFNSPLNTPRSDILDLIVSQIKDVSGISREKSTIKYYIYDSKDRRKPENRPYRMLFGTTQYSTEFKIQAVQEAAEFGQIETQKKFALPSGTLSGWLKDSRYAKHLQDEHATEDEVSPIFCPPMPKPEPQEEITTVNEILGLNRSKINDDDTAPRFSTDDFSKMLNTLAQLQSDNQSLSDRVRLHMQTLKRTKENHQKDFELKEENCKQLLVTLTANDANINSALDNLIKIESMTNKKHHQTELKEVHETEAELRHESGKLKLRQEQMNREFNEAVRNIPKIRSSKLTF